MENKFVKYPKVGDHVVGNRATKEIKFITAESFSLAQLDQTAYEILGVVYHRTGKKVRWCTNATSTQKWSDKYMFELKGFTLDNTARSGVIQYYLSNNAAPTPLTVSYNAGNLQDFVAQLNAAIASVSVLVSQGWHAFIGDGDKVLVVFNYTFYNQAYYTNFTNGFSLAHAFAPHIPSNAESLHRKNRFTYGSGCVCNMERALAYLRPDSSSSSINPSSDVTSIERQYPVCLPAYLGTSKYQSDHCAFLRQYFGEGEEGWLRHVESSKPIVPTSIGNAQDFDGYELTKQLADYEIEGYKPCKAAIYCNEYSSETIAAGGYYLPTLLDISYFLNDDTLSAIRAAQTAQGKTPINNYIYFWSCCRYDLGGAWCFSGGHGCFISDRFYDSLACLPVSLYIIS